MRANEKATGSINLRWLRALTFVLALFLFQRFVILTRLRMALVIFVGWPDVVVAAFAALKAVDDFLQIIIDGVIINCFALAQEVAQHHHLGERGRAVPLGFGAFDEFIDQINRVFACAILFELIANGFQLLVCIHPSTLPSGLLSCVWHGMRDGHSSKSLYRTNVHSVISPCQRPATMPCHNALPSRAWYALSGERGVGV